MRAWRRPPGKKAGQYTRGPAWFLVVLAFMAVLGGLRGVVGDGAGFVVFAVVAVAVSSMLWWFTAWFMLLGQVRWRVLVLSGVVTGVAMAGYDAVGNDLDAECRDSQSKPVRLLRSGARPRDVVSGAAICIIVGACAGPVFATDTGRIGEFIRGRESSPLTVGAEPSFAAPEQGPRLRDAFRSTDDEASTS